MSSIKNIKRRIKAAKNISQITKAMEMVAASKMRKAQLKALASRPYATKLEEVLRRMSIVIDTGKHFLLSQRPASTETNTIAIMIITPDKGLCGGLNSNIFRFLETFEKQLNQLHADVPVKYKYIAVGKKIREYILKSGRVLHAEFTTLPDRPLYEDILPISHLLLEGFKLGEFYKVYLLYTDFINTLSQKPRSIKLLPIDAEDLAINLLTGTSQNPTPISEYVFEPSSDTILDWLLPYYFELSVYQKILEAQASEHSARMVSMRNASDNAKDILHFLNLEYNRKRQSTITNEIADIVTSRMAIA